MSKTIIVKKQAKVSKKTYKKWTKEEIKFLKERYRESSNYSLAQQLKRSASSVLLKAKALGLTKQASSIVPQITAKPESVNYWTKEEVKFLKENYRKIPIAKIAEKLGRTVGSVSGKIFDVKTSLKKKDSKGTYKAWSEEDLIYLKENYGKKSTKAIAKHLKRSSASVASKLNHVKKEEPSVSVADSSKDSTSVVSSKSAATNWMMCTLVALNILTLSTLAYLMFIR